MASLYDLQMYWLEAEYVKWTTSEAEAKKAVKSHRTDPPPMPVIRPVAHRPPAAHAAAVARYDELNKKFTAPTAEHKQMDARTLAAFLGLGGELTQI